MSPEAPLGWRSGAFSDFIILQRGFDLPVQDRRSGDVPVFASNGQIATHSVARVTGPSVVTGRSGTLGKVVFSPKPSWPLNTTLYVKDFHGNDPEFVYWFLQFFRLDRFGTGTGVPTLNRNVVHNEAVVFPPLAEQRRIAEILSSVDEAIHTTQAVIEQTRKVKEGVLQRLLTKGIGHPRTKQTEMGEIPEEWEIVSLADLAEKSRNSFVIGPFGSDLVMSDYRDEGVPVVFVRDLRPGQFKWKSNVFVSEEKAIQLQAHSVKPGDVIVTKMGLPPGIAALCPKDFVHGVVTADIIRLRPDKTKVDPAFLVELLNGDRARKAVQEITGGQTRPKITLRDYKNIKIALPQPSEQRLIRECVAPFNSIVAGHEEQLTVLQVLKSALMTDLLTGRKRVSSAPLMAAE